MVHCYKLFGDNVLYDANAGSLHLISDTAADLIAAMQESGAISESAYQAIGRRRGVVETAEAMDEIHALIEGGQLFAPDEAEPDAGALETTHVFKSLCMHLAHDCNMRCSYCFASEGHFGMKRELMSYETACSAIDFVSSASTGRTNIEIDFFGGEPLLNFDVLKRVVDYARRRESNTGKKFRFTLTTNGLLLNDKIIGYINSDIDNLVLSIDGRKEVNDALRKRADGSGTYDDLVAKFKSAIDKRDAGWYIRGTYTTKNMDFADDVLHLAGLGFDRLSVEPVMAPPDPALGFEPGDAATLEEEYERLVWALYEKEKSGAPIDFFHFNVALDGGPCLARRIKGCGAGSEYAAVAPDGGIYPCHQFVGVGRYRLGNVFEGISDNSIGELFRSSSLYSKKECRSCWAKFLCGGGCAANAWQYNGDINKPYGLYCALLRKRMECALWLKCVRYKHVTVSPNSD